MQIMFDALPKGTVQFDHALQGYMEGPEGITLSFQHQAEVQGRCLVGADGSFSLVRDLLLHDGLPEFTVSAPPASACFLMRQTDACKSPLLCHIMCPTHLQILQETAEKQMHASCLMQRAGSSMPPSTMKILQETGEFPAVRETVGDCRRPQSALSSAVSEPEACSDARIQLLWSSEVIFNLDDQSGGPSWYHLLHEC